MIPPELRAEIRRLYEVERFKVGTIARQLGVHHSTVLRSLVQSGVIVARERSSMLDVYRPFVEQILRKYPTLPASRLYAMVQERGYAGGPDHFRHQIARLRPKRPSEVFARLRFLPAEQAQVDWAHFGQIEDGEARRKLYAFMCVLSYSRALFARFFLSQSTECFLRGHVLAFEHWGGCPRNLLYDNLKSAVLERQGSAIRFHPLLMELADHYRFLW